MRAPDVVLIGEGFDIDLGQVGGHFDIIGCQVLVAQFRMQVGATVIGCSVLGIEIDGPVKIIERRIRITGLFMCQTP